MNTVLEGIIHTLILAHEGKNGKEKLMAFQEITHCGKCGAKIRYIRMKRSGKWMPVDAAPIEVIPCVGADKGGHNYISLDGYVVRARKKKEENLFYDGVDPIAAFESHFATCPAADEFRKRK